MTQLQSQPLPEQFEKMLKRRIENADAAPRFALLGRSFQDASKIWLHEAGTDCLTVISLKTLERHPEILDSMDAHDVFALGLSRGYPGYQELQQQLEACLPQ